jgi:UDP-N-acetylmuramoylalanine--D-glutamate ligase
LSDFRGKNVTIIGLARSGIAAAKKLASLGAKVFVSESAQKTADELKGLNVEIETGGHTAKAIEAADLIVVSPGVHLDIPILEEARKNGIPIISEVELAYRLLKKPIIAVTGTNGKTTTTTLIGELLKAGDKKVAVAGNIGNPLVEVDDSELDYIVAEISSYQLETTDRFKPWVSVILNIQPDHLDRHGSMREYIEQKSRIFKNQTGDDYVVFNADDPQVAKMVKKAKAKRIGFSKKEAGIITLSPAEIKIPGRHNLENALAAAQTAYLCGVDKATVAQVLRTFSGVEHRIEFITSINGVDFYNDSKATNPDSTMVAIETFAGKGLVLILGGKDKGTGLEDLTAMIKRHVKAVILLGEAKKRFGEALASAGYPNVCVVNSIEDTVKEGLRSAKAGEIVLLSPACASFDMFKNFEERGRIFKDAVNKIAQK